MSWIEDNAITLSSLGGTSLRLTVGVDVRSTGVDMFEGQTGAAKFSVSCTIWDNDPGYDDRVAMKEHFMEPDSIFEVTGFELIFDLPYQELRTIEPQDWPFGQKFIELYGELTLRKNGYPQGSSVKTGERDAVLYIPRA